MAENDKIPDVLITLTDEQQKAFEVIFDDWITDALEKGRQAKSEAQAAAHTVALPSRILLR